MNTLSAPLRALFVSYVNRLGSRNFLSTTAVRTKEVIDFPEDPFPVPEYPEKVSESLETRKARIIYQARKRGTLENGLLISTFAAKYLPKMTEQQVLDFDRLINKPGNEWDIYYWAIGTKPTPKEYESEVMELFQKHCKNENNETRFQQPPLFEN